MNSMKFCLPLELQMLTTRILTLSKKVPVIVSGDEGSVFIEVVDSEILVDGNNRIAGELGFVRCCCRCNREFCSVVRCNVQDIKLTQGVERATMLNQLQIMNKNMKRISNQPARVLTAAAG
jgi:hypothetical protein